MVDILGYGAYVPLYRIKREEICKAWGKKSVKGDNSLCGRDEDSLTMSIEAAKIALRNSNVDSHDVNGLVLTSRSMPIKNKSSVTTVKEALDLKDNLELIQLDGTGLQAINEATRLILKSGGNILIIASDNLVGKPGSPDELYAGAGAFAAIIGENSGIATIKNYYSYSSDFFNKWKVDTERFPESLGDLRFEQYVISNSLKQALDLFKTQGLEINEVTNIVLNQSAAEDLGVLAKCGLPREKAISVFNKVGFTGTSSTLLSFAYAIENGSRGRILAIELDPGLIIRVLELELNLGKDKNVLNSYLEHKRYVDYPTYLRYKGIIEEVKSTSESEKYIRAIVRERASKYGFKGAICNNCGSINLPIVRIGNKDLIVCRSCKEFSSYDYKILSGKGKIYSYTIVHYPPPDFENESPYVIAVVELDEGNRITCRLTDIEPYDIKIGTPVEAVFRKLMTRENGIIEYGYKFRPER